MFGDRTGLFRGAHEAWAHVLFRHDILGGKSCVLLKTRIKKRTQI